MKNYSTWVRYGVDGFPLPLGTAHQGRCTYYSNKIKCPVPLECEHRRLPTNTLETNPEALSNILLNNKNTLLNRHKKITETYAYQPVCGEIPNIEFTFPETPSRLGLV